MVDNKIWKAVPMMRHVSPNVFLMSLQQIDKFTFTHSLQSYAIENKTLQVHK